MTIFRDATIQGFWKAIYMEAYEKKMEFGMFFKKWNQIIQLWKKKKLIPRYLSVLPNWCYKMKSWENSGLCWRSKGKLINDVLLWTHQCWLTIHQLCVGTGWHVEDLPKVDGRWERKFRESMLSAHLDDNELCLALRNVDLYNIPFFLNFVPCLIKFFLHVTITKTNCFICK